MTANPSSPAPPDLRLIFTNGSTLVGLDRGSLVGNDGSTFTGNGGSTSPASSLSLRMNHMAARGAVPSPPDADSDGTPRRVGWYVFRDAEGGHGKLGTTTGADGNVTLQAQLDLSQDTLPRTQEINRAQFGVVLNPSYLDFAETSYTVSEGAGALSITVRRSNNLDGSAVVLYQTTSQAAPEFAAAAGTADDRTDYAPVFGTLLLAPGETEKTFTASITDDGLGGADEGAQETFNILLNNANGAIVGGTGSARVTVDDNDPADGASNPVRDSQFFVRQHYRDFLNREPDQAGLDFRAGGIESCGSDAQCRQVWRANTSAAFFLSIEFQQTGLLVSRVAAATFGQTPARPWMQEFLVSTRAIGRGVVVGREGWAEKLASNRQAFLDVWVQRPDFLARFGGMTNEQYVGVLQ